MEQEFTWEMWEQDQEYICELEQEVCELKAEVDRQQKVILSLRNKCSQLVADINSMLDQKEGGDIWL